MSDFSILYEDLVEQIEVNVKMTLEADDAVFHKTLNLSGEAAMRFLKEYHPTLHLRMSKKILGTSHPEQYEFDLT